MGTSYGPPPIKDMVNHPPHYKANGMEAIDVIEAFAPTNYHRGNALKYLLRAGKKGELAEDLKKAIWYIQREIDHKTEPAPLVGPERFEHACPDIDQGADDSHMVYAEEVPTPEQARAWAKELGEPVPEWNQLLEKWNGYGEACIPGSGCRHGRPGRRADFDVV